MRKILRTNFFNRPTPTVAKGLIGMHLVRQVGKKLIARMITEVEVYDGFLDKASHAYRGKTARNEIMFKEPGHWYVYFIYGNHFMLNIVTPKKGYPAAILIRGTDMVSGPGRLTKKFRIHKRLNGKRSAPVSGLWIEDREVSIPRSRIERTPRIGVDYAGSIWSKKRWRFVYTPASCKPGKQT